MGRMPGNAVAAAGARKLAVEFLRASLGISRHVAHPCNSPKLHTVRTEVPRQCFLNPFSRSPE
jgi:hypothetical protein